MGKNKTYALGLYEKAMPRHLSWGEKLKTTKACGFDYLEISVDETDEKLARLDYNDQEVRIIQDAMKASGVPILTMCLSGHRRYPLGDLSSNQGLIMMYKAIELAIKLGIRIIQLAGYDVFYGESSNASRQMFQKNLKKSVAGAAMFGVHLAFETMETDFMNTVAKAMKVVRVEKSPFLGVYPDIGNLKNALIRDDALIDDLQLGRGYIVAAHLKETRPNVFREIPFGTGHTPFKLAIDALNQQGVRMFVGEMWYTGSERWQQDIKNANTFLRTFLDESFKPKG